MQYASKAASDVLQERLRQVQVEGWTTSHDDQHVGFEMTMAACSYAGVAACVMTGEEPIANAPPAFWPWADYWWKPSYGRRDLVKAAALLIAEIERLDRASKAG